MLEIHGWEAGGNPAWVMVGKNALDWISSEYAVDFFREGGHCEVWTSSELHDSAGARLCPRPCDSVAQSVEELRDLLIRTALAYEF